MHCSNYDTWTVELLHIVHAKLFLFAKKMKDSDYIIVFFYNLHWAFVSVSFWCYG